MERERACLKCGSIKSDATFDALEECPKCGAIYARVESNRMASISARKSKNLPPRPSWRIGVFAIVALTFAVFAIYKPSDEKVIPVSPPAEVELKTQEAVEVLPPKPPVAAQPVQAPIEAHIEEMPPTEAPEIEAAKRALKNAAKDPDSVQFRNVTVIPGTQEVCGEYNARNGYGGYNGFKPFWVNKPTSEDPVVVTDEGVTSLATIVCEKYL